ncbi:hypothetical protein BH18ACT5_BH18ACT5_12320 [soil metagenome]
MQFKGSLRSPGDRGPGIRVILEVDEYHLQIRRGPDLMGRWYLADVEVVRDIAERFTLFLGADEMEFLADDTLVFAYDGVTRMQQGWVKAQKKKRRHRRAAAEAARRKDEGPNEELIAAPARSEPEQTTRQPTRKPAAAPTSELAKKLAAIAAAEDDNLAASGATRFTWADAETDSQASQPGGSTSFDWATAREEMAVGRSEPEPEEQHQPIEPSEGARLKRRATPAPTTTPPPTPWLEITPAPVAEPWTETPEPQAWPEPSWVAPTQEEPAESAFPEPSWIAPEETRSDGDLRRRYEAIEQAVRSNGSAREAEPAEETKAPGDEINESDQEAQTPPRLRRGRRPRAADDGAVSQRDADPAKRSKERPARTQKEEIALDRESAKPELSKAELRLEGHHPIESNTGLLGKLRRAPKVAEDHVHVYQESRSAVGLTRRVCTECSHVSISSDD